MAFSIVLSKEENLYFSFDENVYTEMGTQKPNN